ncbi:MAG: 16S rRNA (uracil(1498)-N(3))-methyltransferase [Pseudarcicella sp.]|nr:16S rRNA (uracil(1498)-N(3))-methyltransferase [Pseudarcicella sp.]MBP6410318.1 16S rRNA (uracil(1498)-N(3))-methyltransferase [Pseudarcicella sp.]
MPIFYSPDIEKDKMLSEEESKHCVKVLRLQVGDIIDVVDGVGGFFECEILQVSGKRTQLGVKKTVKHFEEKLNKVHLIVAPTKNMDRMEWMVEKCVEIGIDEISFVQTRHSERKEINLQRIEKIAISAMKQSKKAYLPKLNEMQKLPMFLKQNTTIDAVKFIAHLEETERKELLEVIDTKVQNYQIMIGPEGDFSPEEITLCQQNGFQAVSLGTSRLRTETACVVSCHTFSLKNNFVKH